MTREEAVIILDGFKNNPLFSDTHVQALDMAISALSALSTDGEYIKKEDAISKILIEFVKREKDGKPMCACTDVKQTCADILDGLTTYSFPDSAESKGEWIPVSERLPEIHQDVLLSLRSLDVEVGFRGETEPYYYCHGDYIEPQNVLAWQPLPEPYKAERGE